MKPFTKAIRDARLDVDVSVRGSINELVRWAIYWKRCYLTESERRHRDFQGFYREQQALSMLETIANKNCWNLTLDLRGDWRVRIFYDPRNGVHQTIMGRGPTIQLAAEECLKAYHKGAWKQPPAPTP